MTLIIENPGLPGPNSYAMDARSARNLIETNLRLGQVVKKLHPPYGQKSTPPKLGTRYQLGCRIGDLAA